MRKCGNAVVGEKLLRHESSVRGCIVIMEHALHSSGAFSPNVLPQTAKNIAVELGVHGLALGGMFMVHNPSSVEKHDEELVSKLFDTATYICIRIR
jgi:hypothetical protein